MLDDHLQMWWHPAIGSVPDVDTGLPNQPVKKPTPKTLAAWSGHILGTF